MSYQQLFPSHAGVQKRIFHKFLLRVFKESTFLVFQDCDFALPQETVMCVQMFRSSSLLDSEEMNYFQTCL